MDFNRLFEPSYIYRRTLADLEYFMTRFGLINTSNYQKLASLKNKYTGQRCFIIGNGPSLKIKDLEKLNKEITLACNKIYLAFDDTQWRPTFYSAGDKVFLENSWDKLKQLTSTKLLLPIWTKYWFPPLQNAVYFRALSQPIYPNKPQFSSNALKYLYWGATVTYLNIQLASYMGIRQIYLLGVDCDYKVPKSKEKGEKPYIIQEKNSNSHFHPNYLQPGEQAYPPNLHWHKNVYQGAKEALHELNGEIYNATRGGKLEIFPRVNFDSLF